jgi:alpha-L-fucosidase
MSNKKFEASFESLRTYECPSWFRDAKLGFWSHWGPQSVPMAGDWYARNMYIQGTPQYLYHLRHYGHPSNFGYKDIARLWKAEKFNPEELMDLYVKAGARYFVAQAMHHDHFFNYPSKLNRFNSTQIGPMKDICGLWKKAAYRHGLPFGLSEHLGATFSWWAVNKGMDAYGPYAGIPYDGIDPEYQDFYMDNYGDIAKDGDLTRITSWYTANSKHHRYWLSVIKELINMFTPDLLYTDGGLPFGYNRDGGYEYSAPVNHPDYVYGLDAVSSLYNKSIDKNGENKAVYLQKDRREVIHSVGIVDIEKSQLPGIQEKPWHTDTCIGNWFYDAKHQFKRPEHIIEILIDIVSKNGTMLLNILQRPDGSLDDETIYILNQLSSWVNICGEGIYCTRPWRLFGEGSSLVSAEGSFREDQVDWTDADIRFTSKGNTVYAFMMKTPKTGTAIIKSFTAGEKVIAVSMLGEGQVPFSQNFGVLVVNLPYELPTMYANCLAIELAR